MDEKDLGKLFRTAGHAAPSTDLSPRIMARVAVTPLLRPTPARPLIGRWGWLGMGFTFLLVVVLAVLAGPADGGAPVPFTDPVTRALSALNVPDVRWTIWVAGASVFALLLVWLDHSPVQRNGQHHKG